MDSLALFSGAGAWPTVAQRVAVFGIYSSYPLGLSDSQLAQMISLLNAHKMPLEIEAPALQATSSCGNNVEGFAPSTISLHDYTLTYLNRLKLGGANVAYVKVDEPFYFGNVSNEANTCHLPVATIAQDVYQFVQLVHSVYPNAEVGDTEPVMLQAMATPDPVTAITRWWDAYQAASGSAFPFYVADMDFSNPTWTSLANDLAADAHQRGLKFGIIYTGDIQDSSDAAWAAKAIARFELYQGSGIVNAYINAGG